MNAIEPDYREFMVWELTEGHLEYTELAVSDIGHLHIYIQEKIIKLTSSAPSLEELEYLGKKPVVVIAKESNYWLLVYEKGQVVAFEQFNGLVN